MTTCDMRTSAVYLETIPLSALKQLADWIDENKTGSMTFHLHDGSIARIEKSETIRLNK